MKTEDKSVGGRDTGENDSGRGYGRFDYDDNSRNIGTAETAVEDTWERCLKNKTSKGEGRGMKDDGVMSILVENQEDGNVGYRDIG